MQTLNVAELDGALLDYWAGRADNINPACLRIVVPANVCEWRAPSGEWKPYSPSTRWGQGGRIIEGSINRVERDVEGYSTEAEPWYSECGNFWATGATPLIAATRARLVKRYGDTVPEVLA